MGSVRVYGAFLLLFIANVVEIQCQGPRFESPPRGWFAGVDCRRNCNGELRNCFFHFRVETMYTMSKACFNCPSVFTDCFRPDCMVGGGIRRVVTSVNRQIPGPAIEACEGDRIRVLVENKMETGEATTIHWHGQHMKDFQYMDGVPFVTQCPILAKNNMTYEFIAATPGTHWWHSHQADQRGDGHFGPMIIRQAPANNPYFNAYHTDGHTMIITDWNNRRRMDVFQAYAKNGEFLEPTGILINGYGDQMNDNIRGTPMANFIVRRGNVHRFRLINANFFDCPFEVTIDNHKLTVISSDGQDVQPVEVDSIVSNSGERFDFLVNANQAVNTYWIRVKGTLLCERLQTYQLATLTYDGSSRPLGAGTVPNYNTANNRNSLVLNPTGPGNARFITIDRLRSLRTINGLNTNNVRRFFISLDMSGIDHPANHRSTVYGFNQVAPNQRVRTPQLNHLTFKPFSFNLMANRYNIRNTDICTAETTMSRNCQRDFCECPHVLEVNLNEVVELVMFDEMDQDDAPAIHPMHLHGFSFAVVHYSEIGPNLTRPGFMMNHGSLPRNFANPPLKDTVNVPRGGATIVRFVANNPGFWFLHCHIDVHAMEGMELVIKVGSNAQISNPPANFPTCGNWPV